MVRCGRYTPQRHRGASLSVMAPPGALQTCPASVRKASPHPLYSTLHSCQMGALGPSFLCLLSYMPVIKLALKIHIAIDSRCLRFSQGGLGDGIANTSSGTQPAGKLRVHHACEQPQDHASAHAFTYVTRMCKHTQPGQTVRLYHWHSSTCRCYFSDLTPTSGNISHTSSPFCSIAGSVFLNQPAMRAW